MTEIPSQSDRSAPSPFQEEIVLENYYASESSKRVLLSINQAVADGVPLMILTGDEGTGKTMLCTKLDRDPQDVFTTVFFPRTVDSFEGVVRAVANAMNIEPHEGKDGRNIDSVLTEISEAMDKGNISLFLIFDEAENIYLATLERIRKMLDRLSAGGGRMHVLFSGRKTFLENSQQLSMCDFDNDEEYHIVLDPLSQEETATYLQHCAGKIPDVDGSVIFTPEVMNNIYELSGGNLRMINILAEEAINKNGDDTSFMVLLENVKEDFGDDSKDGGFSQLIRDYIEQYRSYIPYGVVFLGILIIGALFFSRDSEELVENNEPPVIEEIEEPVVIKIEPAKPVESEPVKIPNAVTVPEDSTQVAQIESEEPVGDTAVAEESSEESSEGEPLPEVEIEVADQTKFSAPVVEEEVIESQEVPEEPVGSEPVAEETVAEEPPEQEQVVEAPVEPPAPPKQVEEVELVTLERDGSMKRRPGKLPKTTQVTIKEEIKKEKSRNEVSEVIATNAHFTTEQLYKKRIIAGTPWYNNERDDKYTVQLMVLTSDEAEENLKKMLREDRYRLEAGNFYIFKKLSTSDTIFVFYGEYSTIAQARLAQNSLPRFLRDHKPYAISVKGAMAKVRR